jgi:predicted short-subunit dehydrogenase-like oxidoreductase (DUF2520 family)
VTKYGISIVGAGRIGRSLGRLLKEKGWRIHGVVTQNTTTARRAVRAIGAGRAFSDVTPQVLSARVILIAVPESAITGVVGKFAQFGSQALRGKVVLYTSGALSSDVLAPLRQQGAAVATMHPLQTFSGVGIPALDGRIFVLEGDPEALRVARNITRTLGGQIVQLKKSHKTLYHAAAVFSCGQVLTLLETSVQIFGALGLKRREALKAILPLTRQVLENLEGVGPRSAWTGPLARGDYSVVSRHERSLQNSPAEYLDAYRAVNRLAARVLAKDPEAVLRELRKLEGK